MFARGNLGRTAPNTCPNTADPVPGQLQALCKQERESSEVEKRGVAELERSSIGNALSPSLRSLVYTLAFVDAESVALHVHHASEKPGISLRLFPQARGPAQLVDPFFGLSV